MASSRPWPFDDEDRPGGSVQPLRQADLQAILAHLGEDPTSWWPAPSAIGRWWRCGFGPAWAAQAAPPTCSGGGCGPPSGPPGPGPGPGGSQSPSVSAPPAGCLAAYWRPGWDCSLPRWRSWPPPGGCGSGPARTPSPGDALRRGSDAPPSCSTPSSSTAGPSCMTWPSRVARPISTLVSRGGCITSALTGHSAVEVVGAVLGAVSRGAGRGVGAVATR